MTSFPNEYEHDAVEVKVDCRIKIDRQGYNTTYRDMIPEQFIHTSTNGERYTKLKKGEHGWRTRVSLDGNFSVCNFQRGERVLTYSKLINISSIALITNVQSWQLLKPRTCR
jgi:hypothetical protein